ncbi:MAG: hypothetical protein AAAC47_09500 [Pararhizobium sp.]
MRIGEKPQECLQRFFDFFAGDREQARQQGDERVVENGRDFDAAKGGAPVAERVGERSGSPVSGLFSIALFRPCGNNSPAVIVLSPNLLDTKRRTP